MSARSKAKCGQIGLFYSQLPTQAPSKQGPWEDPWPQGHGPMRRRRNAEHERSGQEHSRCSCKTKGLEDLSRHALRGGRNRQDSGLKVTGCICFHLGTQKAESRMRLWGRGMKELSTVSGEWGMEPDQSEGAKGQ